MVQAILAGRKVQTRRIVKDQPSEDWHPEGVGLYAPTRVDQHGEEYPGTDVYGAADEDEGRICPYGKPGDRLWVAQEAETYSKTVPIAERFWSRVYKFESCWEWFGLVDRKGYGRIRNAGEQISTHRLSWELANGHIPAGKHVLHTCDLRWCVNPDHLYLGNNDDNISDKVAHGRVSKQNGSVNGMSILNDAEILSIKLLSDKGWRQQDIAERHSVTQSQISRILSGKRWLPAVAPMPLLGHRTLEIAEVRVQRLQETSAVDAIYEGVLSLGHEWIDGHFPAYAAEHAQWKRLALSNIAPPLGPSPVARYRALWEDINGARSWAANPWVWVVSFSMVAS